MMKDRKGNVLTSSKRGMERWKEGFEELMNEKHVGGTEKKSRK